MMTPELNTDVDKQLYEILEPISKTSNSPEDFMFGTFVFMNDQEKRKKLLNYIIEYEITDEQDVTELVMCIHDGEEPEFEQ